MLLLALLLSSGASRPETRREPPSGGRGFRPLAWSRGLVLLHDRRRRLHGRRANYGRADYQLGDGAHKACGKEFPSCNGGFLPFGQPRLVDIHLTHRAFMYLATILVLALVVLALRRRPSPGGRAQRLDRARGPRARCWWAR